MCAIIGWRRGRLPLHRAIRLLRSSELSHDYAAAFGEWADSGDEAAWEAVAADGLVDG